MVNTPERGIVLEDAVDMVNYTSQTCATISTVMVNIVLSLICYDNDNDNEFISEMYMFNN